MAPQTTRQWTIEGTGGFDDLKWHDAASIPQGLNSNEVLVNFHYASLNFRDLIIPKGQYPFPMKTGAVPGSDGAGTVVAIGNNVHKFKVGDKVATQFGPLHQSGHVTAEAAKYTLGGGLDGVLRDYGVFPEHGLVHMPKTLDFQQAATLPCAALTAWNCLYGLEGRAVIPGQYVLTQGTGGVSVFAVQFAKAAGCIVIATTSSEEKAEKLKQLGADHVINYKSDPNWGKTAKSLTPNGVGVDHIIEVGGSSTQEQSLNAIKPEGVITIIGFVGGAEGGPTVISALMRMCTIRGGLVGSVAQFEEMNAAIDANGIKPVVDEKVFDLKDLKQAYEYMLGQNHVGKVTIKIS